MNFYGTDLYIATVIDKMQNAPILIKSSIDESSRGKTMADVEEMIDFYGVA